MAKRAKKATSTQNTKTSSGTVRNLRKWPEALVLSEARRRTKELSIVRPDDSGPVHRMLAALMIESGWTDEEFVDALCRDFIDRDAPTLPPPPLN